MARRELTREDMELVQSELETLLRMGLLSVNEDATYELTDKGIEAINEANAQTWS